MRDEKGRNKMAGASAYAGNAAEPERIGSCGRRKQTAEGGHGDGQLHVQHSEKARGWLHRRRVGDNRSCPQRR